MVLLKRRKVASYVSQGLVLGAISMFLSVIRARIRCKILGQPKVRSF